MSSIMDVQTTAPIMTITTCPPFVQSAGATFEAIHVFTTTSGGPAMESQMISDLSARMRTVEENVSTTRADISAIKERLTHMPTTTKLLAVAVGASAVVISTLFAAAMWLAKPWVQQMFDQLAKKS